MKWRVWNEQGGTSDDGEDIEAKQPGDAAIRFVRDYNAYYAEYPSLRVVLVMPTDAMMGTVPEKYAVTLEARPEYTAARVP